MSSKWLVTYQKLEPEIVHRPMGTHRLTLSHGSFFDSEANFNLHGEDPITKIAFFFPNSSHREIVVSGIGGMREMVLIDDSVFLRLNRREIKSAKNGKGYSFKDKEGRLVVILQYVGTAEQYYRATRALREVFLHDA